MKLSNNFFKSVLLAVVFASVVSATPFSGSLKHTSTQKHSIRNIVVESFYPESSFEVSHIFQSDRYDQLLISFNLVDFRCRGHCTPTLGSGRVRCQGSDRVLHPVPPQRAARRR